MYTVTIKLNDAFFTEGSIMVLIYKCPSCGSNMKFDSEQQMMVCEHCNTAKSVTQMEQITKEAEMLNNEQDNVECDNTAETMEVKVYKCPACGAELLTDENTSATFCNFCGNATLIENRLQGVNAPTGVIPFEHNKEEAVAAFKKWSKKGLLTPKEFVSQNTIEKITGMYVPFWLYDYNSEVDLDARCTRVRVERHGNKEITNTEHYNVHRNVTMQFNRVPADASEKMDDDIMDKLEPFDYGDIKKFEIPYLSGYVSEKYNFTSKELEDRVESRLEQYAKDMARGTINGYATTAVIREDVTLHKQKADYILMPVWMLNYRYKGQTFTFTMNGQTGKVVGKLPISVGKVISLFAGSSVAVFAIIKLFEMFI